MASAIIGSLRVNLGVDSANFQSGLKQAQGSVERFGPALRVAMAGAAAAAAAALTTVADAVQHVTAQSKELRTLAQVSNTSFEEFQRLAYAAQTVGIEQSKLADIFRDMSDRVGDFLATGGGPMADFFQNIAPKVGLTADAFRNLSGPKALQLYYDSLVKAGVSQNEMSFYLEAMASDVTDLIPLLANGGAGFRNLGDEADRLGVVIGEKTNKAAQEWQATMGRIAARMDALKLQIAEAVMPALNTFANWFEGFDPAPFISKVGQIETALNRLGNADIWGRLNSLMGVDVDAANRSFAAMREGRTDTGKAIADKQKQIDLMQAQIANMRELGFETAELEGKLSAAKTEIAGLTSGARSGPNAAFAPEGFTFGIKQAAKAVEDTKQTVIPAFTAANKQAAKEVSDAWAGLREVTLRNEEALGKFGDSAGEVARTVSNSVSSWIDQAIDRTFSLREALAGLARDIGRLLVNRAVSSLVGRVFGGLPGFADGGSFKVGGAGGVDSQLVAFKASPNETVSVTKPGQVMEGGGSTTDVRVFVDQDGNWQAAVGRIANREAMAVTRQGIGQYNQLVPARMSQAQRRGVG